MTILQLSPFHTVKARFEPQWCSTRLTTTCWILPVFSTHRENIENWYVNCCHIIFRRTLLSKKNTAIVYHHSRLWPSGLSHRTFRLSHPPHLGICLGPLVQNFAQCLSVHLDILSPSSALSLLGQASHEPVAPMFCSVDYCLGRLAGAARRRIARAPVGYESQKK
jgi:hypothetical protein